MGDLPGPARFQQGAHLRVSDRAAQGAVDGVGGILNDVEAHPCSQFAYQGGAVAAPCKPVCHAHERVRHGMQGVEQRGGDAGDRVHGLTLKRQRWRWRVEAASCPASRRSHGLGHRALCSGH